MNGHGHSNHNGDGGLLIGDSGNNSFEMFSTNTRDQYHAIGNTGRDTFHMNFVGIVGGPLLGGNPGPAHGHHIYGDISGSSEFNSDVSYSDTFNFWQISEVSNGGIIVGRIDDYDARDQINIGGTAFDPTDPSSFSQANVESVRIVGFGGARNDRQEDQAWLLIKTIQGGTIFYALEGARIDMTGTPGGAENGMHENHFLMPEHLPADFDALPDMDIASVVNFVPEGQTAGAGGILYNDRDFTRQDVLDWINVANGNATDKNDAIAGGLNDDRIDAGKGHDKVWGGSGNDLIRGNNGNDTLHGNNGDDRMHGQNGLDKLFGGFGDDYMTGGSKNDELYGEWGNDEVYGGSGDDSVGGGRGEDLLFGGSGSDALTGGAEDDELTGGVGRDDLWGDFQGGQGASGDDTFIFADADMINIAQNGWDHRLVDTIHDFHIGSDVIRFTDIAGIATTADLQSAFQAWRVLDANGVPEADTAFVLRHYATDNAIVVNVQDDATWADFMTIDNFVFG